MVGHVLRNQQEEQQGCLQKGGPRSSWVESNVAPKLHLRITYASFTTFNAEEISKTNEVAISGVGI